MSENLINSLKKAMEEMDGGGRKNGQCINASSDDFEKQRKMAMELLKNCTGYVLVTADKNGFQAGAGVSTAKDCLACLRGIREIEQGLLGAVGDED